mgnify:CR=1 FL=1
MKILSNSAKCLKCGESIFSGSRHHYVRCTCGNVFVDGGMSYIRHGFEDKALYQNTSIEVSDELLEACMHELEWCDDTGRNNLGKVCAIFRAIRDTK